MNGDIHIDELLKREAGKTPIRLPKDPLILPGVAASKGKAESASASKSEPQGFQGNTTLARLAALEGAAVQNASAVGAPQSIGDLEPPKFDAPEVDIVGGPMPPLSLLDQKAYEFMQVLAAATRGAKVVDANNQKPEFGGDIFVVGHSKTGQQEFGFDTYQKSRKGEPEKVRMFAHANSVVAMAHIHPPVEKGVWKEIDCENRNLSQPDLRAMKRQIEDITPALKDGYRADTKIYAYLGTPDGQIRRFDPDDGWTNGVTLWPSGTLSYYEDFTAYDAETLNGCKR